MSETLINIRERIDFLGKAINHHRFCYYILDNPEISDSEFDKLYQELTELEAKHPDLISPNSPTQSVGYNPSTDFRSIKHQRPMLSLDNATSIEDIAHYLQKINKNISGSDNFNKFCYLTELKIDGLSLSLIYEHGQLIQGLTRGNGSYGEDITLNVKTIKTIPKTLKISTIEDLPQNIEVRGEVFMPVSSFNNLNEGLIANGQKPFANPRNASSGSIRQKDPKLTLKRNLAFFAYFLYDNDKPLSHHFDQTQQLDILQKLGFLVEPNYKLCQNLSEIESFCNHWDEARFNLDYQTDGLVIKLNNAQFWEEVGSTTHSPRWAIAYKFPPQQAFTILESIDFEIGRTGVVTPVANLHPVTLAGSVVKRATLHNYDQIKRLDIRLGDTVIIEKAGEVIPAIVSVDLSKRLAAAQPVEYPQYCPSCNSELRQLDNDVAYRCVNYYACPSQKLRRLEHFVSREAMNIEGLGVSLLKKLLDAHLINSPVDIYKLTQANLLSIERMGLKSAGNILVNIEKSKENDLSRLIFALGIRHVGLNTANLLANYFKTLPNLAKAKIDELEAIEGVGPIIAQAIVNYFSDPHNIQLIDDLESIAVNTKNIELNLPNSGKLNQKSFVLTGQLQSLTRLAASELIKASGGIFKDSLSSKTDYLVVGENPGSKLLKAQKLGIMILDETQFKELVNDGA